MYSMTDILTEEEKKQFAISLILLFSLKNNIKTYLCQFFLKVAVLFSYNTIVTATLTQRY
jgi:hypothetical protein